MAEADTVIEVELIYAEGLRAITKCVSLPPGSRVADALKVAGEDPSFACLDLARATLGIYGLVVGPDQVLNNGDRLEVYRPLAEDPRTARRKRAKGLGKR